MNTKDWNVFTVDTKINDIRKWETVGEIAYEKIYLYLKLRGYTYTKYNITDHPGVIRVSVHASPDEGRTLVKELAEIYPDYNFIPLNEKEEII